MDQYLYVIDERTVPDSKGRLFSGHTHVQVLMELASGKIYCNPGSVGQPRDGDCRAAYAIIKDDCIELRRVSYDIDAAAFAMQSAGFEAFIYEGLYKGAQIGGRIDRVVYVHDVQKT
ncbi:metallophosphoesterase family protein [Melaminivora jejuensis]|uniref:metallophosphoesterase family protein n=1 Tax=Melaminivora jejuensis TaxID=1267217 RepID=UPI0022793F05|nr:metallophosphoesterase family protein [Melaminivora jejuensis]